MLELFGVAQGADAHEERQTEGGRGGEGLGNHGENRGVESCLVQMDGIGGKGTGVESRIGASWQPEAVEEDAHRVFPVLINSLGLDYFVVLEWHAFLFFLILRFLSNYL